MICLEYGEQSDTFNDNEYRQNSSIGELARTCSATDVQNQVATNITSDIDKQNINAQFKIITIVYILRVGSKIS